MFGFDSPLNDQKLTTEHHSWPTVNYEDENINVGLPIFSIHGNHDDPQGTGAVSARRCSYSRVSLLIFLSHYTGGSSLRSRPPHCLWLHQLLWSSRAPRQRRQRRRCARARPSGQARSPAEGRYQVGAVRHRQHSRRALPLRDEEQAHPDVQAERGSRGLVQRRARAPEPVSREILSSFVASLTFLDRQCRPWCWSQRRRYRVRR